MPESRNEINDLKYFQYSAHNLKVISSNLVPATKHAHLVVPKCLVILSRGIFRWLVHKTIMSVRR